MALSAAKYRRLPDLFVTGTEVELGDGLVMWMQALNPFEQDEARHDATVARSRLTLALKSEAGSEERQKVEAAFWGDGPKRSMETLISLGESKRMLKALDEIENDPDWSERMEIIQRSPEIADRPDTDPEKVYLNEINTEYVSEVQKRMREMAELEEHRFGAMSDQELLEAFVDAYLERRGGEVAIREHRLMEVWYGARVCDGEKKEDGSWDHSRCDSHRLKVFDSKAEVRELPEALIDALVEAMNRINMTVRDARFSARQGSSSESSPLPSEGAESTPSTQTGTPSEPRGSSPQLSPTR